MFLLVYKNSFTLFNDLMQTQGKSVRKEICKLSKSRNEIVKSAEEKVS